MRTLRVLLTALALSMSGAVAAKVLQPPLTALRTPSANGISATVLAVQTEPPALQLQVDETFFGRPRTELTLLVDADVLPLAEIGGRYIFVYGDLERVLEKPGVFRQTRDGTLASFDGAEPAMFRDTPGFRALLSADHRQAEDAPGYKTEVFAGLKSADPQLHNLWAAELGMRAELIDAVTAQDIAEVSAFVDSIDSHPSARVLLLRIARDQAPKWGESWYLDSARQIVSNQAVEGSEGLQNPSALAALALEIVRSDPRPLPLGTLTRWLRSSQPALAEQALLKIRVQAPEAEIGVIEAALDEQLLPAATRAFLLDHLRRLRLIPATSN